MEIPGNKPNDFLSKKINLEYLEKVCIMDES